MNNSASVKKRLQNFGLSSNQADLYLFLIIHGEKRITELVRGLNMPRTSIYQYTEALREVGLVEVIVKGSHRIIRAYPPAVLQHDFDNQMHRLQDLSDQLESLDKVVVRIAKAKPAGVTTVKYYEGRAGARQLLWNTLKTHDAVYVYSAWGRGNYVGMKYYQNFVAESKARHIKEEVIINPTSHALDSIRRYTGSPVSRTVIDRIHCVSKDDINVTGETFIYDNVFAQIYLKDTVISGFEIVSDHFVRQQRSIFEALLGHSQPVAELL